MRSRTNYKTPMFFGWYSIDYKNKRGHDKTLELKDNSNKELDYFQRR